MCNEGGSALDCGAVFVPGIAITLPVIKKLVAFGEGLLGRMILP